MTRNYHIEYAIKFGNRLQSHDFKTDDPLACEEFLVSILEHGLRLKAIRHDGVELPQNHLDDLVKAAASILAEKLVARSLNLDPEEVHDRFGIAA